MSGSVGTSLRLRAVVFGAFLAGATVACEPKNAIEAESRRNVKWLIANPTGESVAALGRLADSDPRALTALEARKEDVNVYVAAWAAVTRSAPWGTSFLRTALGDPSRAELAASALPRKDARLVPLLTDLEGAVVRLAAGKRGSVLAGILASIGTPAHAAVERRVLDGKTRAAMCDGIGLPEASDDAKAVLLAAPAEARDQAACVTTVLDMAVKDDAVLDWLGAKAEPGFLAAVAKGTLACPRVATIWKRALAERPIDGTMTVPLQRSIARCAAALDPQLADLITKTPRARATIIQAIDPFANETGSLTETCAALKRGIAKSEAPLVRERANDTLAHGCRYTK